MKEGVKRGIAVSITSTILIILLLAGPAQAVILGLTVTDTNVQQGDTTTFTASIEIESGEFLEIDHFTLKLHGPDNIMCKFYPDGTIKQDCEGITINKLSGPDYTYGYGYGYGYPEGEFEFEIILDTTYYRAGTYATSLIMEADKEYKQDGEPITIIPTLPLTQLEGCSIRAEGTTLTLTGPPLKEFDDPKINFHIPLGNADQGTGALTAQNKNQRVAFDFKIVGIQSNTPLEAKILVQGPCKLKKDHTLTEATITYHKITNTIDVIGTDIIVMDMDITFSKRC